MRNSKTLAKLRHGRTVRICALGHFIPAYPRHAAACGFDCIWLDLEHRNLENREVQALLAYCHLADIDCMVRPPTLEKSRLYRYLEDGATGLLIPHVSTPEKAQMLADAVKFPPLGDRGLDGAGFDADFLHADQQTYPVDANRETFLVVQIETPQAVANVDEIAAVKGVDGMFVGPGDLGLRLRNTETDLTLEETYKRVAAAAERHGKDWGCPVGSTEDMQARYDEGGRLLAHGGDFRAMMAMLESCAQDFDAVEPS